MRKHHTHILPKNKTKDFLILLSQIFQCIIIVVSRKHVNQLTFTVYIHTHLATVSY